MPRTFHHALRDVSKTILTAMTAEEYATWLRSNGRQITFYQGHYWKEPVFGYYMPVHWLGRINDKAATRPSSLCWGYRAALTEEDRHLSNATMPVHLLTGIREYDFLKLSPNRKRKINRYLEQVEVVEFLKPDILLEHGYDVLLSAYIRNGYGRLPTREEYRRKVEKFFLPKGSLVLGSFIGDKLAGYTVNEIVEETVYSVHGVFATEYLPANISTCLDFRLMEICKRSGVVSEITLGLATPERPSLGRYKEEMDFRVVHVPARVWVAPVMGTFIRKFYPYKYFRLTGSFQPLHGRQNTPQPEARESWQH